MPRPTPNGSGCCSGLSRNSHVAQQPPRPLVARAPAPAVQPPAQRPLRAAATDPHAGAGSHSPPDAVDAAIAAAAATTGAAPAPTTPQAG
jgi:hypothetical protein